MIKGQQDISKLRNEMGDINKAGAGRKFLVAIKSVFERSRKAKFPKGVSGRKDMGMGTSVQSFHIKKPERGSLKIVGGTRHKSAGVDNLAKLKFGGVEQGNPAKVRDNTPPEKLPALKVRFTTDKFGDRSYTCPKCQHHGGAEVDAGYVLCRGCGRKVVDIGNTAMKSLDAQINDLSKGRKLMRLFKEIHLQSGKSMKDARAAAKADHHFVMNELPKKYKKVGKSLDTQINDIRKDVLHGNVATRNRGKTTFPPMTSTELSQMHHAAKKPMVRQFAGPNIASKVKMLQTENARKLPGAVKTTTRSAMGAQGYQTRRAAKGVGTVRAGVKRAHNIKMGVAGGLGAAAVVGGGALLARHLINRHKQKQASRQAVVNPAAGTLAQGMMGALANMKKRVDRMGK